MRRYLPILDWSRGYSRATLSNDLIAALIVTIMLIPQSLAYAMLAGLPPEAGIYASILPIMFYAVFGTSRVLAVGPVAVVSLMTAATIGKVAEAGTADYATAALALAFVRAYTALSSSGVSVSAGVASSSTRASAGASAGKSCSAALSASASSSACVIRFSTKSRWVSFLPVRSVSRSK